VPTIDRRRRRTDLVTQALTYQLLACCEDGAIHAMVVADADGLALASSGDRDACDEVAATMAQVGARTDAFSGTLLGGGQRWDVAMTKLQIEGGPLLVCAIGGSSDSRARQLTRGARGAARILGAA
jgi:predicted regulator of Ras-like GTPase activity (Roadblock/LC7/MglB family)